MTLEIVLAALEAGDLKSEKIIIDLRRLAESSLAKLGSDGTRVAYQVREFIEWLDDPRIAFSDSVDGNDKFAELIAIARNYQDCTSFFQTEVGVNTSTIWRWASGKSRPSKYVGKRLAVDVQERVSNVIWQLAWEKGLVTVKTPVG